MLQKIGTDKNVIFAVVFQAVVLLLAAFGFLPREVLLYLAILAVVFMAMLPPRLALNFFILSLPWFFAVPITEGYDRFQIWRILAIELFVITLLWDKANFKQAVTGGIKKLVEYFRFSALDYSFFAFLFAGMLSLTVASFAAPGIRYIIWLLNIYLFFVSARLILKTSEARIEAVKTAAWAAVVLVAFGFLQLLAYLFVPQVVFWQYWANTFIPVFYGQELAQVTTYFNSWFSYFNQGAPGLRMFSLMPGSHFLALLLTMGLSFLLFWREQNGKKIWTVAAWFTILAVLLSAVRGAWVAALFPIFVFAALKLLGVISKANFKKALAPFVIFAVFFLVSPLANAALTFISPHNQGIGNLYSRAGSSADQSDISNRYRLELLNMSVESFKERPLLGLGLANFPVIFGPGDGRTFGEIADEEDPLVGIPKKHLSAHNLYLNILVETGIVGLLAFFVFLYFVFRALWRNYKNNRSIWTLYFGLALLWVLGQEMFDASFLLNDKTLILFLLGVALTDADTNSST